MGSTVNWLGVSPREMKPQPATNKTTNWGSLLSIFGNKGGNNKSQRNDWFIRTSNNGGFGTWNLTSISQSALAAYNKGNRYQATGRRTTPTTTPTVDRTAARTYTPPTTPEVTKVPQPATKPQPEITLPSPTVFNTNTGYQVLGGAKTFGDIGRNVFDKELKGLKGLTTGSKASNRVEDMRRKRRQSIGDLLGLTMPSNEGIGVMV